MAEFFLDSEGVEQCLGGMLADSVAGVDDGFARRLGRDRRRADLGVAQKMITPNGFCES